MVFGLTSEVLKDGLFPEALHQIPVLDLSLSDRISQTIGLLVCDCLVSDMEIQVFHSLLLGAVFGGNHRGNDVLGLCVPSKPHLGVTN